jgi:hypothetical protein
VLERDGAEAQQGQRFIVKRPKPPSRIFPASLVPQTPIRETTMTLEIFTSFLAWCTLINLVFVILWWLVLAFAGGWMRGMHRKWFDLSDERFAAVHYKVLAYFKMLWVVFNLTPYLALQLFV